MPGFLTHCLAGRRLKEKLRADGQKILAEKERLFYLGCQGPDIFFYYFSGAFSKAARGIGGKMHDKDLGRFIWDLAASSWLASRCGAKGLTPQAIADGLADKDGPGPGGFAELAGGGPETESGRAIFAYACGYVMHYCLDSATHPYVFARTETGDGTGAKNTADHRHFETELDICMLLRLEGKKPNDWTHFEMIDAKKPDMAAAALASAAAIRHVYGAGISGGQVLAAMRSMVGFTKFLQSKKGRRKRLLRFFEKLTVREPVYSSLMHSQAAGEGALNLEGNEWQPPWPGGAPGSQSFPDLFDGAVEEAVALCETLLGEGMLGGFSERLGNKSLKTGT